MTAGADDVGPRSSRSTDHGEAHATDMRLALNPFELVVVAALRTKQLTAGCVPRVRPAEKLTSTAMLEVLAGLVVRMPPAASDV